MSLDNHRDALCVVVVVEMVVLAVEVVEEEEDAAEEDAFRTVNSRTEGAVARSTVGLLQPPGTKVAVPKPCTAVEPVVSATTHKKRNNIILNEKFLIPIAIESS